MIESLEWLQGLALAEEVDATLCAGDVFDRWDAPPAAVSMAIDLLPRPFLATPGNHDLRSHRIDSLDATSLGVLSRVPGFTILHPGRVGPTGMARVRVRNDHVIGVHPFWPGEQLGPCTVVSPDDACDFHVALAHAMICENKKRAGLLGGLTDLAAIRKMTGFNLIVSGDNHRAFYLGTRGRFLVNPGGLLRTAADEAERDPAVFIWEDGRVKRIEGSDPDPEAVSRDHLAVSEISEARLAAFAEAVSSEDQEEAIQFRDNVRIVETEVDAPAPVRDVVASCLEVRT
jgi:DNA repair exonuclease SbcCD nuclease subunit